MGNCADSSLLHAGASEINRWRIANPGKLIRSPNVVFQSLDLSGANLSGADLRNSKFLDCDLRHVNFVSALLLNTRFSSCILDGANFASSDLTGAAFGGVYLEKTSFVGARGLARLKELEAADPSQASPIYDPGLAPWMNRLFGWERLRFLARIRIFVPSYVSLVLTVLYLNSASWINVFIDKVNLLMPATFGGNLGELYSSMHGGDDIFGLSSPSFRVQPRTMGFGAAEIRVSV